MPSFYLKIAGVIFDGRQELISRLAMSGKLKTGTLLRLVPDPRNPYDSNAVKVVTMSGDILGFIPKQYNSQIAMNLRRGQQYKVTVSQVTGGFDDDFGGGNYGINIMLEY